ncbi:hypothetical protein Tco_0508582 [Tanacetum coccineum]
MNLTIHTEGKKKVNPLVIPGVRFTKLIINHLQSRHKFHKRLGSLLHMPYDEYALGYLKFSFKNTKRRFLAGEEVSDDDAPPPKPAKGAKPKTTKKPTSTQQTKPKTKPSTAKTTKSTPSQPPKPKPAPAKPQEKKRKRALDAAEAPSQAKRSKAGVPATKPTIDDEQAIVQKVLEESMKDAYPAHWGPLPPVTPKKKNPAEQFIFQRRTPATAEPSGIVESSSLYAELDLTDSGTESEEEVSPEMNAQGQEEGQGGTNPGDTGVSQTPSSHVVHAGPNLDHMDLGIAEASSQPNTEQMDDEFTATAYPKDLNFTDQFLVEKSQEDKPEKTNTEAEVPASMPTTTATVTETTTTTTVLPPPAQPQQDVSTSILIQTIGQLEQNIANLVEANQALKERLDKQGNRIHQLETQDLSRLIREQTHAMRALLRARFKDLPTSDMKEILLQRMLEENYDKGHEDHKMAYEALQKSIIRDESEKFDADKAEE